jgi:hypothetical protein
MIRLSASIGFALICLVMKQSPDRQRPAACPVREDSSGWNLVGTPGFQFCVPVAWTPGGRQGADSTIWRGDGGQITWHTGLPPSPFVGVSETIRSGANRDPVSPIPLAPSCSGERRQRGFIDGHEVELVLSQCRGVFRTSAVFAQPVFYFEGTADSLPVAALQIKVYGTVRFTIRRGS